ncbi:MAG: hypothetical protein M0R03_09540 [Novosphingobium sp.]|nr:hypothetical protein [Novosphingobium sp.]
MLLPGDGTHGQADWLASIEVAAAALAWPPPGFRPHLRPFAMMMLSQAITRLSISGPICARRERHGA